MCKHYLDTVILPVKPTFFLHTKQRFLLDDLEGGDDAVKSHGCVVVTSSPTAPSVPVEITVTSINIYYNEHLAKRESDWKHLVGVLYAPVGGICFF